jgi:hypothetical protein
MESTRVERGKETEGGVRAGAGAGLRNMRQKRKEQGVRLGREQGEAQFIPFDNCSPISEDARDPKHYHHPFSTKFCWIS